MNSFISTTIYKQSKRERDECPAPGREMPPSLPAGPPGNRNSLNSRDIRKSGKGTLSRRRAPSRIYPCFFFISFAATALKKKRESLKNVMENVR